MGGYIRRIVKIMNSGECTELSDEIKERVEDQVEKDNKPVPSQFSNVTNSNDEQAASTSGGSSNVTNSNDEQAASTSGGSSQPPIQASSSVTTGPARASCRDPFGGLAHMDYATFLRVGAWVNSASNGLMQQKPF